MPILKLPSAVIETPLAKAALRHMNFFDPGVERRLMRVHGTMTPQEFAEHGDAAWVTKSGHFVGNSKGESHRMGTHSSLLSQAGIDSVSSPGPHGIRVGMMPGWGNGGGAYVHMSHEDVTRKQAGALHEWAQHVKPSPVHGGRRIIHWECSSEKDAHGFGSMYMHRRAEGNDAESLSEHLEEAAQKSFAKANAVHGALTGHQYTDRTYPEGTVENVPTHEAVKYTDIAIHPGYEHEPGGCGNHKYPTNERWDAFKDSIKEHGIGSPIQVEYCADHNRAIVGEGNHRLAAAHQLGISHVPMEVLRGHGFTCNSRRGYALRGAPRPDVAAIRPNPRDPAYIRGNMAPSDLGIPVEERKPRGEPYMKALFVVEDPIVDVTPRSLFELVVDEPRMMKDFEKSHDPLGMTEDHIAPRDVFAGEGSGMKAWVHPTGEMHELPWVGEHSRESARIGMTPTDAVHANYARVGFDGPERGHQGVAYGEFHHFAPEALHRTVRALGAQAERSGHAFAWECHDGEPSPRCAGATTNGHGMQSLREHFGLRKSQPGTMKLRPGERGWMTIRGEGPMSGRPIRAEMGRGMKLRPPVERKKVNLGPEIGMRDYTAEESKSIRALPHEKAHADDLLKQYRQSTPEQRKRGHNWYPRASQIVDRYAGQHEMPTGKKVGYSRSQISGALAALSPRQNWGENVFMLDRVVRAHQHGTEFKRVRGLGFRGNGQKAWRILGGADPAEVLGEKKRTGQKVRAFHHALENFDGKEHADHSKCDQPTVVDQLMDRAMHGSQKPNHRPTSIDGKVYREHSNAVRVAAMRAGVEPWALQATVWTKMNDEGGAAPRTHVAAEGQPHMLKLAGVWPGSTKRRKLVLKSHSVWRMTSSS